MRTLIFQLFFPDELSVKKKKRKRKRKNKKNF